MHSSIPVIKRQGDGAAQDISAQRVATKMGSAPEDAILTAHQVPSYVVAARSQATSRPEGQLFTWRTNIALTFGSSVCSTWLQT